MSIRLRHLSTINPPVPGWEQMPDDCLLTFVPLEAVWPGRMNFTRARPKSDVSTGYTRFMEGDVIVPKITPTFEADRSTWIKGSPTTVLTGTTELHVVRPGAKLDPRYLDYLLSSRPFLEGGASEMIGVAGQRRVPDEWLRDFRVPITGLQRQREIADFLDSNTTRIDALISKKRRLIELLSERLRRFTISYVTGEGSKNVWTSGPYWLGPVPRSWMPHKIAWCKQTGSGTTPESGNSEYYDALEGIPWITTSELRETSIRDAAQRVTSEAFRKYSALKVFPPGSVLIAMYGATVGRLGVLEIPAATNQACCAIYGAGPLDQRFLYWWLWANREHLISMAYGAGQPNISQEIVRGLRIPAPEVEEQREIVDRIEREADRVERSINKLTHLIELFIERRQALITAAVSGEMSVLEVQA